MSKIEISNDTRIIRHRTPARISHWMLVICFFMTMFTGVAFFFLTLLGSQKFWVHHKLRAPFIHSQGF